MQCNTIDKIDPETGFKTYKFKVTYDTQDEAIEECTKLNMKPNRKYKVVPYKCNYCNKYHAGRNGKLISGEYRSKHTIKAKDNRSTVKYKVIGKIDLTQFGKYKK